MCSFQLKMHQNVFAGLAEELTCRPAAFLGPKLDVWGGEIEEGMQPAILSSPTYEMIDNSARVLCVHVCAQMSDSEVPTKTYRFKAIYFKFDKDWFSLLSISTKLRIYSTCVLPVLLYGSETWTLIQADWKKLDSFHLRCQRRILHISWDDFVSNDEVLRSWTSHTSSVNEDWASLVMSPDFEAMLRQTRSSESVPRRGVVSSLHRSGDEPAADHLPPGFTRSVVTRDTVYQRPRACC